MKFGAIMQACRERAKLSQDQLAEKLNRSRSCISKYENDAKEPSMNTMLSWMEVTNSKDVLVAFFCGMDGMTIMQNLLSAGGLM